MIIYFANRKMEILGNASTHLPNGYMIADDLKTEDIETGIACFECKLPYSDDDRTELAELTEVGNYILRSHEKENEFYTIIETETDTKDQTIYIYAEDAGLDLLNEIAPAYEATGTHTAEWYVNRCIYDSGFEIGINEIPDTRTRKLSWDSEQTVTERLASIATGFGGFEVSYSFDVDGLTISHKYINIYEKRGKNNGVQLRLNNEVDRIVTTKSIANVATALKCTGGIPEKAENPITLSGYSYDDGDFFVDGVYLKSREALADWSRYAPEKVLPEHSGHIVQLYEYDTLSQATLCSHAITELKKLRQIEVNYEVDIKNLPDGVAIGDRVNIIDDDGELYLSTRILKLETSIANNEVTVTLGEYLIKSDGISEKVEQMAADLAKNSASAQKAKLFANEALTIATEAGTAAADAQTAADNAQTAANTAQTLANNAQIVADNAQVAAEDAAKTATLYITDINENNGIKVAAKDNTNNYLQVNSSGMSVCQDINNSAVQVASLGANGIVLGIDKNAQTIVTADGIKIANASGIVGVSVDSSGTSQVATKVVNVYANIPASSSYTLTLDSSIASGTSLEFKVELDGFPEFGEWFTITIGTNKSETFSNSNSVRFTYTYNATNKQITITANSGDDVVLCFYRYDVSSDLPLVQLNGVLEFNGDQQKDIKIEVGTSGNWTYEKWSSGIVKMYYTGTYSSAFNNGNYFGAYRGTAQTLTYPFTLASVTYANVDHVAPNTGFCVLSTYDTTQLKFYPYNRTNQKATQSDIKVIAEVVGRWNEVSNNDNK